MKKRYITSENRDQYQLGTFAMDELIKKESPVRMIEIFVERTDFEKLGFVHAPPAEKGRPAYDPKVLAKLYLYGHMNRLRSSRILERECKRNVELWWLLGRLCPDHNTIAIFRKVNRAAIKKLFVLFVRVSKDMGLLTGTSVCIDGTPFKAVNGLKKSTSMELSQKKLDYARESLRIAEAYLNGMDESDKVNQGRLNQPFAIDIDPTNLPDPRILEQRIAQHEEEIARMTDTGEKQLTQTDPDSRVMVTKDGGKRACYNVQTAVDANSHMIVGFDVTNDRNDANKLFSTAEVVRENLGCETLHVVADKGYEDKEDIEKCLMNGITPDVGFIQDREQRVFALDYLPHDVTEELRASTKAADIRTCLHAGVLSKCYEGTNIRIEKQVLNVTSCFIRHADGRVTCPIGREMHFLNEKKHGIVYGSKEACRTCPNRCTDGKTPKTVKFGPHTHFVPVQMYGPVHLPIQEIPDVEQPNHNHVSGRLKRDPARVMIFIRRDKQKQKERMRISEHPFGTVKHYDGAGYYLCKGFEMVAAETAMMYLSYNMRRAISIAGGVQNFIKRFQGITAAKLQEMAG